MKITRIIAAMSASVPLCSTFVMTAYAEETPEYEKGDVNMDGNITALDAQFALMDYLMFGVMEGSHILTDEQLALADVTDYQLERTDGSIITVTAIDSMNILQVATLRMVGHENVTFDNLSDYRDYLG